MELGILYWDEALVVCEKPIGVHSQGEADGAMPHLLAAQLGGAIFPVHRLDAAVGGVMVFARTKAAAAALSEQAAKRQLTKEYLAVLSAVPAEKEGVLEDLLFFDRQKQKSYVVKRPRGGVKQARLSYRVLQEAADGEAERALVRVSLQTGRTHQIRVQFASRRLPLLGDGKYAGSDNRCTVALWSAAIGFCHPVRGEAMRFELAPPRTFPWGLFSL